MIPVVLIFFVVPNTVRARPFYARAGKVTAAFDRALAVEHILDPHNATHATFPDGPGLTGLRYPLLALDVLAQALAEVGYAPAIVGARSMVVSHACGWMAPFSTWLEGEVFYAEPLPGIRVPTRGCPKCRSSITAASLVLG